MPWLVTKAIHYLNTIYSRVEHLFKVRYKGFTREKERYLYPPSCLYPTGKHTDLKNEGISRPIIQAKLSVKRKIDKKKED